MKKHFVWLIAAVLVALLVPPAVAQECSIQTITGTYAFRYTGESFLGGPPYPADAPPGPGVLPVHSPGLYAASTNVGILTIRPDHTVDVRFWSAAGSFRSSGTTMTGTITSVGNDRTPDGVELGCAATVEYQPFPPYAPHHDKFFVLANGDELRTISTDTAAFPTFAMVGVARRITRALDPAPRCGPQMLTGSRVISCPGPLFTPDGQTIGSTAMFHLAIANGEATGMLFNRSANVFTATPVQGGMTISPDCTGEGYLLAPGFLSGPLQGGRIRYMFVFSNQGKEGFAMPLDIEMPGGATIPYPPVSCEMQRTTP